VYLIKGVVTRSLRFIGPITIPVTLYLTVLTWTTLRTGIEQDDIKALIQTFVTCGVTVGVFANMVPDLEKMVKSLIWMPVFCLPIALLEILTGSFNVFGLHKNSIGGSLAVALIISVNLWYAKLTTFSPKLMVALLICMSCGLLISLSRGAWIGTVLGLVMSGLVWGRLRLVMRAVIIGLPILLVLWFLMPSEKREYAAGFQSDRWNIKMRLQTQASLQRTIENEPLFGVGIGLRKQVDATNFVLVTMAESGIMGLLAFSYIVVTITIIAFQTKRLCDGGIELTIVAIAIGGLTCKLGHGMVDHFWGRGNGTVVWSMIGLLMLGYREALNRKPEVLVETDRIRQI
jgi:O-antigen ligase